MASNQSSSEWEGMDLTEEQLLSLEGNFKGTRNPDGVTLTLIAAECGLSEEKTVLWFKLRNAQWRQAEGLPPQPGSVKD